LFIVAVVRVILVVTVGPHTYMK